MIVVKVGGGEGIDLDAVCSDAADVLKTGQKLIIVHGGSHETNLLSARLGKPPRFVRSSSGMESRYTDRETLDIFTMVYAGKINKYIVARLQCLGVNALGLSGIDGGLFKGPRKPFVKIVEGDKVKVLRDDFTGRVEQVNVGLIRLLIAAGYTLVLTPPALSYEGEAINVDGDRAAAALAASLKAERLVILSNVPGLLKDVHDELTLISHVPRDEIDRYAEYAQGRMKKKLLGAREALGGGVSQVVIAYGRTLRPISQALEGKGTVIS